jgi:hypothetical protein
MLFGINQSLKEREAESIDTSVNAIPWSWSLDAQFVLDNKIAK